MKWIILLGVGVGVYALMVRAKDVALMQVGEQKKLADVAREELLSLGLDTGRKDIGFRPKRRIIIM